MLSKHLHTYGVLLLAAPVAFKRLCVGERPIPVRMVAIMLLLAGCALYISMYSPVRFDRGKLTSLLSWLFALFVCVSFIAVLRLIRGQSTPFRIMGSVLAH